MFGFRWHISRVFRPYVPKSLRLSIVKNLHSLAHPGIRPTQKLVAEQFVWNGMAKYIAEYVKSCEDCQSSKVGRHSSHPVRQPELEPTAMFSHIHIDLVGPLPVSNGFKYLLTIVDRATRYPVAIPLSDMSADTVSPAFLNRWISQFGVPTKIVSDRGGQFI